MEVTVRLTSKDLNTSGVFSALEALCRCFKPEEFRNFTIDPNKNKTKSGAEPETAEPIVTNGSKTVSDERQPQTVVSMPPQSCATIQVPTPQPPLTASTIPTASVQNPIPPTVPVAGVQSFTIPQVAQAAAIYAEASDTARQQVCDLIHDYGVAALADIPQDKLGEFATRLRGLGARI